MSALSKLFVSTISKVIKNTTKFEITIDDLIERFKESCPPKDELLQIVKQKNQIQTALSQVLDTFAKIQTTVDITTGIVTAVSVAAKVITVIPAPPFFPSGVLAEGLDLLSNLLKSAKGSLKIVPGAAKTITSAAQKILDKLAILDGVLNVCLEELLNDENMAWDPAKTYGTGNVVTFGNNTGDGSGDSSGGDGISYFKSLIEPNLNISPVPVTVPPSWTSSTLVEARINLGTEIGNVAAESGPNVDVSLNKAEEDILLDRLNANSLDPYRYQKTGFSNADWQFTIEVNQNNEFEFPQRRIRAENINQYDGNPFKGIVVYNIFGKKYSYSLSVQVLIQEAQFVIEQLSVQWYKNNNTNLSYNQGAESVVSIDTVDNDTVVNLEPIRFIADNLEFNNTETKKILIPTNLNNPAFNIIQGRIVTTQVSQSIDILLDSGTSDFGGGVGLGNFNNNQLPQIVARFTPDAIKTWDPSTYPDLTRFKITSTNDNLIQKFTYNAIGSYIFKLEIINQSNINGSVGGKAYLRIVS